MFFLWFFVGEIADGTSSYWAFDGRNELVKEGGGRFFSHSQIHTHTHKHRYIHTNKRTDGRYGD